MRVDGPDLPCNSEAVYLGHHHVKKAQVEFLFSEDLHSLRSVSHQGGFILLGAEVVL